jgi:hypothetical protein
VRRGERRCARITGGITKAQPDSVGSDQPQGGEARRRAASGVGCLGLGVLQVAERSQGQRNRVMSADDATPDSKAHEAGGVLVLGLGLEPERSAQGTIRHSKP